MSPPSSYQNGAGAVGGQGQNDQKQEPDNEQEQLLLGGTTSPMKYLEQQKRNRLCLCLVLVSVFFVLTAVVAVWSAHGRAAARAADKWSVRAAQALDRLNHRTKHQSKRISAGCESTLILMRHCEKHGPHIIDDEGNQHCSYLGYERAAHLATLFGNSNNSSSARWPKPAHLFALTINRGTTSGHHLNFREYETLQPLSKQSNVMVELADHPRLATDYFNLLRHGHLCGQVVVVSWKHEYIVELATSLGCGPDQGCPTSYSETMYDEVWQLKYVFHPAAADHPEEADLYNRTADTPTTTTTGDGGSTTDDEKKGGNKVEGNHGDDDDAKKSNDDDDQNDDRSVGQQHRSLLRQQQRQRRALKKKDTSKHGWNVYATVTYQYFDPLAFSKTRGDYPDAGVPTGGRWRDEI